MTWQRPDESAAPAPPERRLLRRPLPQAILLVLAAALVVAVHVGLIGTAAARSRWTGIAVDVLAALVLLKIALIVWAHGRTRRRASTAPTEEQRLGSPAP